MKRLKDRKLGLNIPWRLPRNFCTVKTAEGKTIQTVCPILWSNGFACFEPEIGLGVKKKKKRRERIDQQKISSHSSWVGTSSSPRQSKRIIAWTSNWKFKPVLKQVLTSVFCSVDFLSRKLDVIERLNVLSAKARAKPFVILLTYPALLFDYKVV